MTQSHEDHSYSDTLNGIMRATLEDECKKLRALSNPSDSDQDKIKQYEGQISQLVANTWRPHPIFLIVMFIKDLFADLWYNLACMLPFGFGFAPTREAVDSYLEGKTDDDDSDCTTAQADSQGWVPIDDDFAKRVGRRIVHLCFGVIIGAITIAWIVRLVRAT